ncbi:uncharacterized protein LOC129597620 isoform X2 [Paramacrobiotus metropolitanus]|nr:uncharacterized protein LOC129597620 isoform X2 [Paramacrobiotus metropolitanus]
MPTPAKIWLKQYSLEDCKISCRFALEVYDFHCWYTAHYAASLDCVLHGNESMTVMHVRRWTSTASTSTATSPSGSAALFRNSCDQKQRYQCVDQAQKCAYQTTALCRNKDIITEKSTTLSGKACKSWNTTRYPNVGSHNFCANPDGSDGPWCYTTDLKERWGYCFSSCSDETPCVDENRQCAMDGSPACRQNDYKGIKNITFSGLPCKNWSLSNRPLEGDHNYCRNPGGEEPAPWCYTEKGWDYCFARCNREKCPEVPPNLALKTIKTKQWIDGHLHSNTHLADDYTSPLNVNITIHKQSGRSFILTINNWSPRALSELRCRITFEDAGKTPIDVTIPGPVNDWTVYQYHTEISGLSEVSDIKTIKVILPFPWYPIIFVGYGRLAAHAEKYVNLTAMDKQAFSRLLSDLRIMFHLPKYRLWLLGYRMTQSDPIRHGRMSEFDRKADTYLVTLPLKVSQTGGGFGNLFYDDLRPERRWTSSYVSVASSEINDYLAGWAKDPFWTLEHELQHNHGWKDRDFEMLATQYFMYELADELHDACVLRWFKAPLERYEDTVLLSAFQNPVDGLVYVLSAYTYRTLNLQGFITTAGRSFDVTPAQSDNCTIPELDCYRLNLPRCRTVTSYNGTKSTTLSGKTCQQWNVNTPHKSYNHRIGSHNYCRNPGNSDGPWCYTTDKNVNWEYCFNDCGYLASDPDDPVYCVNTRKKCTYKNLPLCQDRIPLWAAQFPDCDEQNPCLDEENGCYYDQKAECAQAIIMYGGPRFTTAEGLTCARSPSSDPQVRCWGDHGPSYFNTTPYCFPNPDSKYERDLCFKTCESEILKTLRAKPRAYIQRKWFIPAPAKFAFVVNSNQLAFVPYRYGADVNDEKIRLYGLKTGSWLGDNTVSGLFEALGKKYYNPQFLQGYGVFVGSQYCRLDNVTMKAVDCENVYTSTKWADLRRFSSGPGDFDLVFRADSLAFFFKGAEYLVYDLQAGKALPFYPRSTKEFLYKVGILGTSFAALV